MTSITNAVMEQLRLIFDHDCRVLQHSLTARRDGTLDLIRALARNTADRITDHYSVADSPASGPIDVVDLFAGCGGLSVGFEFVGQQVDSYRLLSGIDIDEHAIATHGRNLPGKAIKMDLASAANNPMTLRSFAKTLGVRSDRPLVLVGGPPCQGFSAHQKKNGRRVDERNHLVTVFARIAEFLAPDFIVLENVPELLAQKNWAYFQALKDRLSAADYYVRAQIYNLAGFGVPQERFRALVLASRQPFEMPEPFLQPGQYKTVRETIGSLPPVQPGCRCKSDPMHFCTNHRESTIAVLRSVPKDGGRRPTGVGPQCLDKVDGFRDVYGRMYWDRPANTVTAYARNPASGRYAHPDQDRGLTIREAALLQGFPRSFYFDGPFDDKFLQIGNAVPPIFSSYLAAHVLGELLRKRRPGEKMIQMCCDVTHPTSNSFSSGIAGRKKGTAQ